MNSELINALISQIGNIVGIPLAAVLAVWQVKKVLPVRETTR